MPSTTLDLFDDLSEQIGRGAHQWPTDVLKVALTNTQPLASNTVLADITQIASGGGYTNGPGGGYALSNVTFTESPSGTATLSADSFTITATGGTIGPFQWLVVYNDTSATDRLIGVADCGTPVTLTDGASMPVTITATGLLKVTQ
jgi:hypothetical protein